MAKHGLSKSYPCYLANAPIPGASELDVLDKFTGKRATRVGFADAALIRKAIVAAHKARRAMAEFPPDKRRDVLEHCVRRFTERQEELALALCIEAGKPIRDARGEVTRLIDTFRIAAGRSHAHRRRSARTADLAAHARLSRHGQARADRRVRVHHAVQFPAQPRRAQGGAGAGRGLPVRVEARGEDAGRRADHR